MDTASAAFDFIFLDHPESGSRRQVVSSAPLELRGFGPVKPVLTMSWTKFIQNARVVGSAAICWLRSRHSELAQPKLASKDAEAVIVTTAGV